MTLADSGGNHAAERDNRRPGPNDVIKNHATGRIAQWPVCQRIATRAETPAKTARMAIPNGPYGTVIWAVCHARRAMPANWLAHCKQKLRYISHGRRGKRGTGTGILSKIKESLS